jgi:Pre-SET motif/SET domain/Chromo (CHRromatin Organisation MOdifier) domain
MKPKTKKRKMIVLEKTYDVEQIVGVKYQHGQLLFNVKWIDWSDRHNTLEPYEHLRDCSVFKEYIEESFNSQKDDIQKAADQFEKFEEFISRPKTEILRSLEDFEELEYKTFASHQRVTEDEAFGKKLKELVFKNRIYKLEKNHLTKLEEFQKLLCKDNSIEIDNTIDFTIPESFEYITKNKQNGEENNNFQGHSIQKNGCYCSDGCLNSAECCPKKMKRRLPYKLTGANEAVLRLETPEKIIECSDLCRCGDGCKNRVTQSKISIPLCLFKTEKCGWGVRAAEKIPRGAFIAEYCGELMSLEAAERRNRKEYQFTLKGTDNTERVIDAFNCGNIARFFNHSCYANARVWNVNNCLDIPKMQRLW